MSLGGETPEELETLLEDAFVLRDGEALAELFEDRGLLAGGVEVAEARGKVAIALAAAQLWEQLGDYIAGPRRVCQSQDTALLLGDGAISVARRGRDGSWRFAIALLGPAAADLPGYSRGHLEPKSAHDSDHR